LGAAIGALSGAFIVGSALSASGATISGTCSAASFVASAGVTAATTAISGTATFISEQIAMMTWANGGGYAAVGVGEDVVEQVTFNVLATGI
jgi:hypothetical protein